MFHKKSMSIKQINMLMETIGSNYHLEKEDNEIVMVKNKKTNKQVQPNLLAHLKKGGLKK